MFVGLHGFASLEERQLARRNEFQHRAPDGKVNASFIFRSFHQQTIPILTTSFHFYTLIMFARLLVSGVAATVFAHSTLAKAMPNSSVPPSVSEHDWARNAVRSGEIHPLTFILTRVGQKFSGRVVQIELNRESEQVMYHIELVTYQGKIIELLYDAQTAELISASGVGTREMPSKP